MDFFAILFVALTAWGVPQSTAETYAHAMADVCTSEKECIRLASYAYVESAHFAPWVLDFSCNDREWRAKQNGWIRKACDSGFAYGPWQVHDAQLRDKSPEVLASEALWWLRKNPTAWSTWRAAESHAKWWMARSLPRE